MNNAHKQEQVLNARLVRVACDTQVQRVSLYFDRDIILKSTHLPIAISGSPFTTPLAPEAIWTKDAPGVLSVAAPWEIGLGDLLACYIPEGLEQLASMDGGRVLSEFLWGETL